MKNSFLKGTIILIASSIIAKILGALYRVPLIGLIGTNGIGLFQLIFPVYALFLVISSNGLTTAIAKIVSVKLERNENSYIKKFVKSSLLFALIIGAISSTILILLSSLISKVQGYNEAYICYIAIAPSIIFVCLIAVIKGYFQGLQNMIPSSITQIVEQLSKLIFALVLAKILIIKGMIYGVLGSLIGISISEIVSLFVLFVYLLKDRQTKNLFSSDSQCDEKRIDMLKLLVKESFPIMLNSMILPLVSAVESVLIVFLLSKASIGKDVALRVYGLEDGMVGSLINMPIVVAVAISTALLPNLTADFAKNDMIRVKSKCEMAIKYVILISLPCMFIYLLEADKIIYFLYANGLNSTKLDQFLIATNLLKFSSVNIIYLSILNTLTMILQSANKSFVPVRNLLIASLIKLLLNFVFVTSPTFNIYGIVITDILCYSLCSILNIISIRKIIDVNVNVMKTFILPSLSLISMFVVMKICEKFLGVLLPTRILTIVVISLCFVAYLLSLFLLKVFTKEELGMLPKIRPKKTKMIL